MGCKMKKNIVLEGNIIPFKLPKKIEIEYGRENPDDWIVKNEKSDLYNNRIREDSNTMVKTKVKKLEYFNN